MKLVFLKVNVFIIPVQQDDMKSVLTVSSLFTKLKTHTIMTE